MQIGIIYTGVTPPLTERLEGELRAAIKNEAELRSYSNPEILASLRESGGLNPWAAEQLLFLYWQAVREGAGLLYNACSSVGDVVHAAQPLFGLLGVPLVGIDEEMAAEAVRQAKRIAVMATLRTTLEPTCRLIQRCAGQQGKTVALAESVVDVFGLEAEFFARALETAGKALASSVDIIVLAQGSMAWCEERIAAASGVPVLSSPRFGAIGVKKALEGLA